jgi:uncharacterized protein with GYD domain
MSKVGGFAMSFYMFQWRYKEAALKAMVQHPQDRSEAARKAIEAYGGKLHHFFFAFGDFDGVAISEFPDAESATASALTIGAGGAASAIKTTVLISAEEAVRAMEKAGTIRSGYTPPTS